MSCPRLAESLYCHTHTCLMFADFWLKVTRYVAYFLLKLCTVYRIFWLLPKLLVGLYEIIRWNSISHFLWNIRPTSSRVTCIISVCIKGLCYSFCIKCFVVIEIILTRICVYFCKSIKCLACYEWCKYMEVYNSLNSSKQNKTYLKLVFVVSKLI